MFVVGLPSDSSKSKVGTDWSVLISELELVFLSVSDSGLELSSELLVRAESGFELSVVEPVWDDFSLLVSTVVDGAFSPVFKSFSWFVGKSELELLAELSVASEEGEFEVELSVFELIGAVSESIPSDGIVVVVVVLEFVSRFVDKSELELLANLSVTSEEGEFEVELSVFDLVGPVSELIPSDGIVVAVLEFTSWFVDKFELELLAELSVISEEGEFEVEFSVFEVIGAISDPLIISGGVV